MGSRRGWRGEDIGAGMWMGWDILQPHHSMAIPQQRLSHGSGAALRLCSPLSTPKLALLPAWGASGARLLSPSPLASANPKAVWPVPPHAPMGKPR